MVYTLCFSLLWLSSLQWAESVHCFFLLYCWHCSHFSHKILTCRTSLKLVKSDCCTWISEGRLCCWPWSPESYYKWLNDYLCVFRSSRRRRWLAGLRSGPVAVFGDTDEDVWEAGEGRSLCPQQPCGSPHDQLLRVTAEQSAAAGWVTLTEAPETSTCSKTEPSQHITGRFCVKEHFLYLMGGCLAAYVHSWIGDVILFTSSLNHLFIMLFINVIHGLQTGFPTQLLVSCLLNK